MKLLAHLRKMPAMDMNFLDFEQPIAELEAKIEELRYVGDDAEININEEIGRLQAKSQSLTESIFSKLDDWQVSPPNDPIPNAQFTTYKVDFLFDRGQDQTQISVKGNIKFYVTSRDSFHEGADRQYYQMVGQIDLTTVE